VNRLEARFNSSPRRDSWVNHGKRNSLVRWQPNNHDMLSHKWRGFYANARVLWDTVIFQLQCQRRQLPCIEAVGCDLGQGAVRLIR
jgi:hypothetical protein